MKTQATISQPSAVPGSPLLQVSGALFGIIAFILIAAWLAKRFGLAGKTAAARGLKVSASTSLGPRERVVIVDVEDARLVLGITASNISVLHKLPPAPVPVDESAEAPADFQSVMKSLLKRSGRS
ncbi:flagellar biosynthetic protein FliO [Enterobacter huaxiensis]|jgi:flagellar protein FliO/FliZ|uniref:Flagellar protein n=1 Tax=Enterobacter huaxiensis TaxID=2494702 RepID=A0A428LY34_9ENTR|nr:flagellar biosynthetic protein FliO [Enterobacter huaxiensis]MCS5449836.1 flagellar biosynthetic protein FliO [Enterobacter huaxiensis]MEB7540874.1 flagellar type III secretion system protein FliO [Enterobacter huaxiensis]MEB7579769.1 flagellar type III secretion system protein FliO [Enterobacter huaxiensis]MEB7662033.1 flagellar type III secretion system protein FliO [Enterobacter huaxiensis]RSK70316.1 flagellar type III secretion system protein FliO [Enterobacter huaxiensis]